MKTEHARGTCLVAVGLRQRRLYVSLLEFVAGLLQKYPPIDHLGNKRFQLFLHDEQSQDI